MRQSRVIIPKSVEIDKEEVKTLNIQPRKEVRASSSSGTVYTVNTGGANLYVRSSPSTSASILTKMPNGTKFTVTETKNGWGKHTYNGKTGWSSLEYAKRSTSTSTSSGKYVSQSTLDGTITLREPNLNIKAKKGITLKGLGSKISGLYYVESVEYVFDGSGLTQKITVSREWKGESMKNGSSTTTATTTTSNKTQVTPTVQTKTHTVVKGDTLWAISKKYYGKGSDYMKIYNANKNILKNPNLIYPGQKLTIP